MLTGYVYYLKVKNDQITKKNYMKMWFKTDILCCFCHPFLVTIVFKLQLNCMSERKAI